MTEKTMPIADITVAPLGKRRDLGKLRDLQQSIRDQGLLRPIPVTADGMLIAGERRLRACQNLGWDHIDVVVATDDTHAVVLLAAEHADIGPCHKPRSATDLALLGLRIEDLERSGAEERQIAGTHRQLAEGGRRQSRDVAAEVLGMSRHHYIQIRAIVWAWLGWETVLGGHERIKVDPEFSAYSRTLLDLVDRVCAGERIANAFPSGRRKPLSVNAIYEQWCAERVRRGREVKTNSYFTYENAPVATQRAQRESLAKGIATLSGLCRGLASITEIDPAVTREEAAAFDRDLSNASRVLRGLHNKIKEYAHGNA